MDDMEKLLKKLKWLLDFDGKFVAVEKFNGLIFEIRPKEDGHSTPHFHVKYAGFEGSYSLIDFKKLAGNLPRNKEKQLIEWAENNHQKLKDKWNEYHQWNII